MYDCIIVGGGPAGMTAAIYTARKNLRTLLLTQNIGGQMIWSSDVENYTGFTMITGADLALKFREHVASLLDHLELHEGVTVMGVSKNITSFAVTDSEDRVYYGRSIILATGKSPRHLGVPGEKEFFGRGVAVCATCDAPLYKNKDVAVVGGGNSALDAIHALSKVARMVYAINLNSELSGEAIIKDLVQRASNVQFFNNTKTVAIEGEKVVTGIRIAPLGKPEQVLAVSGVFTEIGYEPSTSFEELTDKNDKGEVVVDQNLQSSVPGIFAAGDNNDAWGEQIIIAAGEGAKAALAVSNYLTGKK